MTNELVTQNRLTPAVWQMITAIADASYEARQFGIAKPGEAAIKLLFCFESGLPLTAANTGLYIVNGKLAIQSNLIAAKFRMHPHYDYRIKRLDDSGCEIEIYRLNDATGEIKKTALKSGEELIGASLFTEDDASRANLLKKSNWREFPRNMYFGRAMTNGYRWFAPDLFSQPVFIPDELGLRVDENDQPVIMQGQYVIDQEVQVTVQDLIDQYGVDVVLAEMGDKPPVTQADVDALAAKLGEND